MYSLLVSIQAEAQTGGSFEFSKSRFLEYTSDSISVQLQALSKEGIECIKSWPCILMQEGRGQEVAHVGQITAVEDAGVNIKVVVAPVPSKPPILNDALWKIRADLDIEQFEFSRNHWAIKDRDLLAVLRAAGYPFARSVVARFENKPLPAPSRSDLINARKVISEWSHTGIDDFLLEAGVAGLKVGRTVGGRRDRANAIIEFAIENPTATTAENSLFSAFIARVATSPPQDSEGRNESSRTPALAVGPARPERAATESSSRSPNRVFIVHGQNDSGRSAIVSFLSSIGLEGIVLHDQPNMGRHLLTKFIDEASLSHSQSC